METIEVSQAEMAPRIARFSDQESQSAHYAEALGIPREGSVRANRLEAGEAGP